MVFMYRLEVKKKKNFLLEEVFCFHSMEVRSQTLKLVKPEAEEVIKNECRISDSLTV